MACSDKSTSVPFGSCSTPDLNSSSLLSGSKDFLLSMSNVSCRKTCEGRISARAWDKTGTSLSLFTGKPVSVTVNGADWGSRSRLHADCQSTDCCKSIQVAHVESTHESSIHSAASVSPPSASSESHDIRESLISCAPIGRGGRGCVGNSRWNNTWRLGTKNSGPKSGWILEDWNMSSKWPTRGV